MYSAEVNLWRAVVGQAIEDHVKYNDDYVNLANPDFLLVCDYAGLNPYKMKEQAIKKKAGVLAR